MKARPLAGVGVALVTGFVLAGAAPALAVCDAYSGTCTTPAASPTSVSPAQAGTPTKAGTAVKNNSTTPRTTVPANDANTLPFTGGELVLMTAIGAGALAGGTALVVAGRRKSASAAE